MGKLMAGVRLEQKDLEAKVDDLVKSQQRRRSRVGGSPELLDLTGFPLSREWRKRVKNYFLRTHQS